MLWYSLETPRRGASNGYPQHMFLWRNKKKYQYFFGLNKRHLKLCMHDPSFMLSINTGSLSCAFLTPEKNVKTSKCWYCESELQAKQKYGSPNAHDSYPTHHSMLHNENGTKFRNVRKYTIRTKVNWFCTG